MHMTNKASQPVLDVVGTLSRLGDDEQLFREMLQFFLEDSPSLMLELQAAANADEAASIRSRAHALKGFVAGCGGVRAALAAQRIEKAAEESDLSHLEAAGGRPRSRIG